MPREQYPTTVSQPTQKARGKGHHHQWLPSPFRSDKAKHPGTVSSWSRNEPPSTRAAARSGKYRDSFTRCGSASALIYTRGPGAKTKARCLFSRRRRPLGLPPRSSLALIEHHHTTLDAGTTRGWGGGKERRPKNNAPRGEAAK